MPLVSSPAILWVADGRLQSACHGMHLCWVYTHSHTLVYQLCVKLCYGKQHICRLSHCQRVAHICIHTAMLHPGVLYAYGAAPPFADSYSDEYWVHSLTGCSFYGIGSCYKHQCPSSYSLEAAFHCSTSIPLTLWLMLQRGLEEARCKG